MTKILQSLDDQCKLGDRGRRQFCQQIGNQYTIRGVCLEQRGTFSIHHYAGG